MKVLILNNHTKDLGYLTEAFPDSTVLEKEFFDPATSTKGFDAMIISGASNAPTALRHSDVYAGEISAICNGLIPVIGICLGCELVNIAFGGTLKDLGRTKSGDVTITSRDKLLTSMVELKTFSAYEHHSVGIDILGEDLVVAAVSDHGPEIIMHESLPVVGIQFHPEVRQQEKIFEWALQRIGIGLR